MDIQAVVFAVGDALAGTLAKGALLLAVAAVVSFCLRRRASASVRHAVWHMAFIGLLLLPLIAALGPQFQLPGLSLESASAPAPMQVVTPQATAPALAQAAVSSDGVKAADMPMTPADNFAPSAVNAAPSWLTMLLLAWALGTVVLLARLGHGLIRIARLSRRADPVEDPAWVALAGDVAGQIGLHRKVALRRHADIEMPMTFGIRRPVILLPATADTWPVDKRRLVLLHELAHVQRGDALTQLIMHVARALHWPNPLAWLGARRFLLTREQACDDRVLTAGARPSDYAGQLVDVARGLTRGSDFAPTPAMAAPSELKTRIQSILDERRRRRGLSRPGICAMAALAVTIVLPLAALHPASAETGPVAAPQNAQSATSDAAAEAARAAAHQRAMEQRELARAQAEKQAAKQHEAVIAQREKAAAKRAKAEAKRAAASHQATDPQTQIQKQAVFALSRLPAKQSVPRLIEIAKSNANLEVRTDAVFWLGRVGGQKAVAFLNQLVASSNTPLKLREKALFGISQLPKNSVPLLIKVAKHGANRGLREKAIFWLGQSQDPRAADALMDIVQGNRK